jgi:Rps23 Pro-64 3,4-dihydroxylase Tpa1-like proline 4-hydroxylase
MKYINAPSLEDRLAAIRHEFRSNQPFKYTMFDGFFHSDMADRIHDNYPLIQDGQWDGTTYIDQKNKFQKNRFAAGSIQAEVFDELNSGIFLKWLEEVTGIQELHADDELFGGGLHQSTTGAFLNVHVDYNLHPKTRFHRRLNVLVYLNRGWRDEYEGHLELWDLSDNQRTLLAKYAPSFNRCVIFETNEISYHGHPRPLKTPTGVNRKSLATYYYTPTRPAEETASEHNTLYVNTEGASGQVKRLQSGIKALVERIRR